MTTTPTSPFEELLSSRARIPRPAAPSAGAASGASYAFGGGRPDPASFPYREVVEATARMMETEGPDAITYGDPQGYPGLRELVCRKYELYEGLEVEPANIQVANGSGHALSLAFGAFLDPGDPIIVEAPTFSGTLASIVRHGPEIIGVPVDREGMDTAAVREALEALRTQGRHCKLIYTIATFQNPTGHTMSLDRRRELVELAREYGTLILEDDAYGELRFEGDWVPSIYSLDPDGHVIRSGTLSKILGAGMRIGWLCAPKAMIPALQGFNFGGGPSPFTSRVATYYLRDYLADHVALLRDVYRVKRDAMLRGLREVLDGTDAEISHPEGGFFIWVKLPSGTDRAKLSELAAAAGVQYRAGSQFFPYGRGGDEYIRLAYSYDSPEGCYTGARLLAEAIVAARS
jgi:2-aminoadipate transaminase